MVTEKTELTTQEWQLILTGELLMFSLLGKFLLQIPGKKWVQAIYDEELFAEVPFAEQQPYVVEGVALMQRWGESFAGHLTQECLLALQADYTRLFTGLVNVPVAPWESVFFTEERLVFQAQTQDVRAWYRRFGLEINNQFKEPEDHIGLELTFIGHLAKLGVAALAENNEEAFQQAVAAQREFAAEHLFLWAPLWCTLIYQHAHTDFYRGLARIVHGALIEFAAVLNVNIPQRVRA